MRSGSNACRRPGRKRLKSTRARTKQCGRRASSLSSPGCMPVIGSPGRRNMGGSSTRYHEPMGKITERIEALKDAGRRTELADAAAHGQLDQVKALIQAGADVNAYDWKGETPLHCAARNSRADVVQILIETGANINAGTRA